MSQTQALKSGLAIKAVVQLVGGSTSGFSRVAEEYWTTIVFTIAVSVICLVFSIATYIFRTDQRMRQDLHYGGACTGRWPWCLAMKGVMLASGLSLVLPRLIYRCVSSDPASACGSNLR